MKSRTVQILVVLLALCVLGAILIIAISLTGPAREDKIGIPAGQKDVADESEDPYQMSME